MLHLLDQVDDRGLVFEPGRALELGGKPLEHERGEQHPFMPLDPAHEYGDACGAKRGLKLWAEVHGALLHNVSFSFGRNLGAIPALTIVTGAAPAQCGGSVLDPRPLPGNLCFYVFDDVNVGTFSGQASRGGAEIEVVTAATVVRVTWQARWLLNVP